MAAEFPQTIQEAMVYFADADRALNFLVRFRWADGEPECPRCASKQCSFLAIRKLWKCKGCKKQFSAKTGTVMEESPIPIEKWLRSYVDEQAFRFNNREFRDCERFVQVLSQTVGKRLTWEALTAREMDSRVS